MTRSDFDASRQGANRWPARHHLGRVARAASWNWTTGGSGGGGGSHGREVDAKMTSQNVFIIGLNDFNLAKL